MEVRVKHSSLLMTHLGMKKENKIIWVVVAIVEATEGHKALQVAEVGEGAKVGVAPNPEQMKKSKKKTRLLLYPAGQ
ncbi:hypothetical protein Syun_007500 [Stephania yunnanensis]|uniref:Uncharacterized protein n=1 Tax=Stephania yunnanensis TaxID=152371 RepID=A0AAP0L282_9MAGN